jgi:hypothetical protein
MCGGTKMSFGMAGMVGEAREFQSNQGIDASSNGCTFAIEYKFYNMYV